MDTSLWMRHAHAAVAGASPQSGRKLCGTGVAWDLEERAALVALLRSRPGGLSWAQIAAGVADCGSALALWEAQHEPGLFPLSGESDGSALIRAARESLSSILPRTRICRSAFQLMAW